MKIRDISCAIVLLALLCAAAPLPARAATSFDFLFSMDKVTNDTQYFLNLAVGNSGFGRPVIEPVLPHLAHYETDLPVALFVAQQSGRSFQAVVDLRSRGMTWSAVFHDCGVPYETLYTGIERDPGPPYGKAWGYWKKNPHGVVLQDSDIRGLVQVQIGSHLAGVPTWDLAQASGQGRQVPVVVADKKGRPYGGQGHGKGHKDKGTKDKGHGDQGHGNGNGNGPHGGNSGQGGD
jgi:hypothetical protein